MESKLRIWGNSDEKFILMCSQPAIEVQYIRKINMATLYRIGLGTSTWLVGPQYLSL